MKKNNSSGIFQRLSSSHAKKFCAANKNVADSKKKSTLVVSSEFWSYFYLPLCKQKDHVTYSSTVSAGSANSVTSWKTPKFLNVGCLVCHCGGQQ